MRAAPILLLILAPLFLPSASADVNQLQMVSLGGLTRYNETGAYTPDCTADASPYQNCGIECTAGCYFDTDRYKSSGADIDLNPLTGMHMTAWRPPFSGAGSTCPSFGGGYGTGSGIQRWAVDLPNFTAFEDYPPFTGATLSLDVTWGSNNSQMANTCLVVSAFSGTDASPAVYPLSVEQGFTNGTRIFRNVTMPANHTVQLLVLGVMYTGNESDNPDPIFWTLNDWNLGGTAPATPSGGNDGTGVAGGLFVLFATATMVIGAGGLILARWELRR